MTPGITGAHAPFDDVMLTDYAFNRMPLLDC